MSHTTILLRQYSIDPNSLGLTDTIQVYSAGYISRDKVWFFSCVWILGLVLFRLQVKGKISPRRGSTECLKCWFQQTSHWILWLLNNNTTFCYKWHNINVAIGVCLSCIKFKDYTICDSIKISFGSHSANDLHLLDNIIY